MAHTSTTLISSKQHLADIGPGTVISFTQNGTEYKMLSGDTDSITFAAIKQFDLITITGSSLNNKTFTVKSDATAGEVVFEEATVNETSDGSTTMLVNMSGCVSDKTKGDGYYSQTDGVHTVAYHVDSTVNITAILKMQGTLAATPTEDDWFDISSTTPTPDGSTSAFSFNFTGNFVWVRAKCTTMTAGTITKILLNS